MSVEYFGLVFVTHTTKANVYELKTKTPAHNLIVFGVGRHAELLAWLFQEDSEFQVIGFCQDGLTEGSEDTLLCGLPVFSLDTVFTRFSPKEVYIHIAIGTNVIRQKYFAIFQEKGFGFASYISSYSRVWKDLQTGENCFIGQGAVIQPKVTIGDNTIVMGASIGHHTRIGSHVLISCPAIGGSVTIGDYSFVGMNAIIREKLTIGCHNIIGAGTVILHDTGDDEVYSVPSTPKRKISAKDVKVFK